MCTVTWAASATGYRLFMNRDERFTRGSAEPPGVHRDTTVQYLSPTDSDAGGTWIAANEHGLTVCLLNHYPAEPCGPGGERTGYRSRGHLVRDLIPARSAAEVSAAIRRMELARYRPFTLLAMCAARVRCSTNGTGAALSNRPRAPTRRWRRRASTRRR